MKKIYFFNAANFPYAEIDLSKKNIFFVGDNGSGKTTAIRAIHFFYNSDVKALGIEANKDSFKNFYFKYDNSSIVYEFDEYFVLMYKKRGEIKRIFSKKKFNVKDIDTNNLENLIKYAKSDFYFIPKTNEEYKKVVYGLDKRYLDFRLTTIRNYNTFINLYNKIFNVNKAVFDSNSVKETIFTTLDRIEIGKIDYENFLDEISIFRQYFKFYRKFKEKEDIIEKLYELKNSLLYLDKDIKTLLEKISYKKDVEEKEINKILEEIKFIEKKINSKKKWYGYFDNKIKCIKEKIQSEIFNLKNEIEEIKKLKKKFNLESLHKAREDVLEKEELEKKLINLKTSLNELVKGIKNQIEEIDEEIDRLKREKRVLFEKQKEEEIILKRNLEEIYEEKIEKLKEEFLLKEKELLEEIESIQKKIEENLEKKEKLEKELKDIKFKYQRKKEELREKFEKEIEDIKKEKFNLKELKDNLLDEIYSLKRELKIVQKNYEDEKEKIIKEYNKKLEEINEEIKFFENILKTIPNSFKEFLNQNVDNWEEELYPLIDKKLLNKSIKELKPTIVSMPVCGLKVDSAFLDTIPTMAKAEEEIKRLQLLKESLLIDKKEKLKILDKEKQAKEIEILSLIEVDEDKLKDIENSLKNLDEKVKFLKSNLEKNILEVDNLEKEEIKLTKINIKNVEKIDRSLKEEITEIRNKIKRLNKDLKQEIKKLLYLKEDEFEHLKEEVAKKIKEKELLIDKKIKDLEIKKSFISKDERVKEIEKTIKEIENRLKEIQKKEAFLKEYEEKKELIFSLKDKEIKLKQYESNLKRVDPFAKKIFKNIEKKLALLEKNKEELYKKFEIIKKGLKEVEDIKLSSSKKETNEYLLNLINEYKEKVAIFRDKKALFKEIASDIKTSLISFAINGLDVNFNIENLSFLLKEELEKIDELYLFKNKKFEVLKRAKIKELKNLLDGLLDKKIESFERSKEEFLSQIRRINQNLSKIDFGIVRDIKIEIEESNRNILKIFENIKSLIEDLLTLLVEESLFFDKIESERKLKKIEELLSVIKKEVGSETFSLIDVVDLSIKFVENEKENILKVIKNESSTGGSILLKIAIAVSLLELFIKEKTDLFLILDEVSVLSTKNQKLLKEFVNEKGLGVIYVTPDLPLVDVEDIDIYKFRNIRGEFEVIKLIADEGINIERR